MTLLIIIALVVAAIAAWKFRVQLLAKVLGNPSNGSSARSTDARDAGARPQPNRNRSGFRGGFSGWTRTSNRPVYGRLDDAGSG